MSDTKYCPHCGLSLEDATEHPETTMIKKAMRDYFRLTPMWIDPKDLQFIAWARKEKITEAQIQQAAAMWTKDKRFNWKAPTLKDIATYWIDLTTGIYATGPAENIDRTSMIRRISADDVGT